jgi:hypothetical protein
MNEYPEEPSDKPSVWKWALKIVGFTFLGIIVIGLLLFGVCFAMLRG